MKQFLKKILIFSFFIALTFPSVSSAASIFLDSKKDVFAKGEQFQVDVFIDSENERVNAVEGEIIFPKDLIDSLEIRSGNSSINFWIEKPKASSLGVITFSGITPGGFIGSKQFLFSIIFKSKSPGSGIVAPGKIKILQNDGNGTEVKVKNNTYSFRVNNDLASTADVPKIEDNSLPEDFKLSIATDPSVFEGRYFLIFATQDKESGIKQYEVKEGLFKDYKVAESPYVLEDQSLGSFIYVKAIDNSGKERVARLYPQDKIWLAEYSILSIIILLVFGFIFKKIWQRFIQ